LLVPIRTRTDVENLDPKKVQLATKAHVLSGEIIEKKEEESRIGHQWAAIAANKIHF
jgi:hypothetical protein